MNKKYIILFLLSIQFNFLSSKCYICSPVDDFVEEKEQKDFLANFKPDILLTEQTQEDRDLLKDIKDKKLFFEAANGSYFDSKKKVYLNTIENCGAKEKILITDDEFRISSLYRKVKDAPFNIIYVTGYFHDLTPPKEWCAPFFAIYPNVNILAFDWRGYGNSDGRKGKWSKNDFGKNAYPDIQAAVDFFKKKNNKPTIVVGFCLGAIMAMHATVEAKKADKNTADALVLNSLVTDFNNIMNRCYIVENRWLKYLFLRTVVGLRLGQAFIYFLLNGNLLDLKPIDMIDQINIPCYFEHFSGDPFARIEEGIEVWSKAKSFKIFMESKKGGHVRPHKEFPYQYRISFYEFLQKSKLVSEKDILELKLKDDLKLKKQETVVGT